MLKKRGTNGVEIKELIASNGITQSDLSKRLCIPLRTVQGWALGERTPPEYIVKMIAFCLEAGADFRKGN